VLKTQSLRERNNYPEQLQELAGVFHEVGLFFEIERLVPNVGLDAAASDPYFCLHYDMHIEKLAATLDRCFSLREEWDKLRSEGMLLLLELDEHFRQYDISQREISDGLWDISIVEARQSLLALNEYISHLRDTLQFSESKLPLYDLTNKEAERRLRIRRAYNNSRTEYRQTASSQQEWQSPFREDGLELRTKPAWIIRDEMAAFDRDMRIEETNFRADHAKLQGELARSNALAPAAEYRARLASTDKQAKMDHLEATHATALQKLQLARDPHSPLNYQLRAERIKSRIDQELASARRHAVALKTGLEVVFNFKSSTREPSDQATIDELYSFVHESIEFLTAIGSHEIYLTLKLSVRQILGAASFTSMLAGQPVNVPVRREALPPLFSLRLVGVSLMAIGADLPTHIVSFRSPDTSEFRRTDNTTGTLALSSLDLVQAGIFQDAPGRIREPVGTPMIHNISPSGNWGLRLDRQVPASVQDFHVEFRLRGVRATFNELAGGDTIGNG
jgi:hypothetical protein